MLRNTSSSTVRKKRLGSSTNRGRLPFSSLSLHCLFMMLIIVAVVLTGLAAHLSTHYVGGGVGSVANDESAMSIALGISSNTRASASANPNANVKYDSDHHRVYCMVPFIWNLEIYDVIMATWGKRCDVINFFTDAQVVSGEGGEVGKVLGDNVVIMTSINKPNNDAITTLNNNNEDGYGYKHYTEFSEGTFPDNVVFVNMTRPWMGCKDPKTNKPKVCRHIWEKMWRSWIYVGDNHLNQAEWFCKVDYDTFFFPENLQYYVRDYKHWDPYSEHHYFGHALYHHQGRPAMAAGAAACWSHKTMKGIAEVYKKMPKGREGKDRGLCEDRPQASEELSTSFCLKEGLNVTVEPMRDEELREYVTTADVKDHLTWNRTIQGEWWYWQGKPPNAGQMDDCCAVRPMGLHKYKRKELIEAVEQQFYGPSDNKELKKLKETTRRYVDKVRRAMGIDNNSINTR